MDLDYAEYTLVKIDSPSWKLLAVSDFDIS